MLLLDLPRALQQAMTVQGLFSIGRRAGQADFPVQHLSLDLDSKMVPGQVSV